MIKITTDVANNNLLVWNTDGTFLIANWNTFFLEDVTGLKTHTSHIVTQNGDLCQKKKTNDSTVKCPLLQESQHLTENDGLPEEVSFLNT